MRSPTGKTFKLSTPDNFCYSSHLLETLTLFCFILYLTLFINLVRVFQRSQVFKLKISDVYYVVIM